MELQGDGFRPPEIRHPGEGKRRAGPGRHGPDIVSFNVQNFVDDSAVIENTGVDNIVKIQKNAAISRAVSERDRQGTRHRAQKEANDAEVAAAQEIAEKKTELAIRQAELQKATDTKRPGADAAYRIREEQQRKSIEITTAGSQHRQAGEGDPAQAEEEAEVMEQSTDAQVRKKAESRALCPPAEGRRRAVRAPARGRPKKYEQEQQAEAMKVTRRG